MNVILVVIFQLIHFAEFIYSKQICEIKEQKTENKQLIEKNIVSLAPMGIQQCSKQCSTTSGCLSFNYKRDHLICELNFASKKTETLVTDDQCDYYDKIDKETADIGACSKMTCPLHSQCIDIKTYGPHCYIFECSEPISINKATLHPGKNLVGSMRQYTCQNYQSCSKSIICQSDGEWTAIKLSCETEFYCGADWSFIDGRCYVAPRHLADWYFAKSMCNNRGGYLARIETSTENENVASLLDSSAPFWIDATDAAKEGIWKYSALGSIIGFAEWYPGLPTYNPLRNCAALSRDNFNNTKLVEFSCKAKCWYICEKKAVVRLVNGC